MLESLCARGGMVVAPHHLAAQAGRDVLREGGNAIEAMVAAAAAIAVAYPHMNALGGDGFWLITEEPGKPPIGIDACGGAARLADRDFYAGHDHIPGRGPLAALAGRRRRSAQRQCHRGIIKTISPDRAAFSSPAGSRQRSGRRTAARG